MHRLLVSSGHPDITKVFFAAVVEAIVNGYITVGGKKVNVGMSEVGQEVQYDADEITASLKSSRVADEYELMKAIKNPSTVPNGELAISFRYDEDYCGRVHFAHFNNADMISSALPDAVIFIIDGELNEEQNNIAEKCSVRNIPMTAALFTNDWNDCLNVEPSAVLKQRADSAADSISFAGWYNPNGFEGGNMRIPENASPYGVTEIFWQTLRCAAVFSFGRLSDIMRASEKTIVHRVSIFQEKSPRRVRELKLARKNYAEAACKMIHTENLLALTQKYYLQES